MGRPGRCVRTRIALGAAALFPTALQAQTSMCSTSISGTFSAGVFCQPAAGTAANIGTLTGTTFNTSTGASIRATASAANATATVAGTTITNQPATAANGVTAQVTGTATAGNAAAIFDGGITSITMQGAGLDGVGVVNVSPGSSTITVTPGTTLNVTNRVTGNEHDGLDITASGGGSATILHQGSGTISTVGGHGMSLKTTATSAGAVSATVGSGVTFIIDNTTAIEDPSDPGLEAGPANHAGVRAYSPGSGTITIDSNATIRATATNAFGIMTDAGRGATSIRNGGAITTDGLNGFGIRASTQGGDVAVVNEGAILATGEWGHGIYVTSGLNTSGSLSVDNRAPITVGATGNTDGSRGIYMIARAGGKATVTGTGDITVLGNAATGRAFGITVGAEAGDVTVNYSGKITTYGDGSAAIRAHSVSGNTQVTYTGARLETFNGNANGIYATTGAATNTVGITAQGTIITHSDNGGGEGSGGGSFGLQGTSLGGDVDINFLSGSIDVNGSGAAIVAGSGYNGGTGLGRVTVQNAGTLTARGNAQRGITTLSGTGTQTIVNRGAIQTLGAIDAQGILARGSGAAAMSVVNDGAISTVGNNASGMEITTVGGAVDLQNLQPVRAGWGTSAGIATAGLTQAVRNASSIEALSDQAVRADSNGSAGSFRLDNTGTMTGVVSAATSDVTLNNGGTWTLRSFADSTGSGSRDSWNVAIANLGTGPNNTVDNTGTLALAAQPVSGAGGTRQPADAIVTFNPAGAYLPLGQTANTPVAGGAVQGQILGVQTFTNSGTIDLTGGGAAVGNVLVIGGGQTAGQYGGGRYVSNGGTLKLNAVLNEGGPASRADMLVADATATGSGGATRIRVNNVGGQGALTVASGIPLVEILSPAASDSAPGAFALDGRAVAGAYEYRLFQGAPDGSAANVWYLRSEQDPGPTPPPTPAGALYRPEVAAYLANQRLAGQMFVHSLHDRLGEPQYVEGQDFDRENDKPRSGWLRAVGKWEGSHSSNGVFKTSTDAFLLQGGAELAKWKVFGEAARAHLGLMGSYGNAWTDAEAQGNAFRAKGRVEGWSVGAYGTWYQNDEHKLGAYVDTWFQYGWFTNRVEGDLLPVVRYHAQGFAVSAEGGYAMPLRHDWVIEPQGQLIYVGYSEDDITEPNGTRVSGADSHGWITRLGARLHRTYVRDDARKWQPYLTLNWWHTSVGSNVSFNQLPVGSMYPDNRYEVKVGVNVDFRKRWTGWTNVSGAWGAQSFYQYVVRAGVKYTW